MDMVDERNIFLVGHSYGAGLAMSSVKNGLKVKKIAVIGPPRRLLERVKAEELSFIKRYSKDRELDSYIPLHVFREYINKSSIDSMAPFFKSNDHLPIFLIDGEFESLEDKKFLKSYYENISEPKKYETVENVGHYLNTMQLYGLPIYIYDKSRVPYVVNNICQWFKE